MSLRFVDGKALLNIFQSDEIISKNRTDNENNQDDGGKRNTIQKIAYSF
jgi:hypothetical protein